MPGPLITLGAAFSAVAIDGILEAAERIYRQQRLQERISYNEQSIYTLYYADSGIASAIVLDEWREVARILNVEPGRLRPADRLAGGLGFYSKLRSSRSDIDRLLAMVRRRLEKRREPPPTRLFTIDDIIRCLARIPSLPPSLPGSSSPRPCLHSGHRESHPGSPA